jgi:organic hydroperoxide reductase OsmC/OhrA
MGNGAGMDFSAPPEVKGMAGVLTPEDAFVGAVNSCIMLMFLWACERLKLNLSAYQCQAVGTKVIELDQTETFTQIRLSPEIYIRGESEDDECIRTKVSKALRMAQKYSLVANSIKSQVIIEPKIEILR